MTRNEGPSSRGRFANPRKVGAFLLRCLPAEIMVPKRLRGSKDTAVSLLSLKETGQAAEL